jgi:hypothetical protein
VFERVHFAKNSVNRGTPFGSTAWTKATAKNLGLESSTPHAVDQIPDSASKRGLASGFC